MKRYGRLGRAPEGLGPRLASAREGRRGAPGWAVPREENMGPGWAFFGSRPKSCLGPLKKTFFLFFLLIFLVFFFLFCFFSLFFSVFIFKI
jgi:hypothetical protein